MSPTSTATSTEMVNALYVNTGSVIDATMPVLPLILGVLFFAIGFGLFVKTFKRAIKRATK